MKSKEALLLKIKALAERGEGGEADNAASMLEQLMAKYGITEADLDDERREDCEFRYSKPFEDKLLAQVIYMVMGNVPVYCWKNSRKKVSIVACTKAEKIEIEAAFSFYREHLAAGLLKYYHAFVQREGLFPDDTKEHIEAPEREADPEEELLYSVLEKHTRHKAIGAGKEAQP